MTSAAESPRKAALRLDVHRDLSAVETAWRSFERVSVHSPYQRFDWVAAWFAARRPGDRGEPAIVAVSDPAGSLQALLPLELDRSGPLRLARFAGGKHANTQMGLYRAEFAAALAPHEARELLIDAGRALGGIDLFVLINQPRDCNGITNPLAALPGSREASPAFAVDLHPDADALDRRLIGRDSRKKLTKKRRWLEEFGPVVLRRAETEAEAATVLDAFFRQKAQRLDALGIANPFALPRTQRFLREAARSGLDRGTPALEIWALWAGDRVAAAFGGCSDGHRLSGTFISFEPDPVMMRSSPGELLVRDLVRASCQRGLASFDLGIGDEGYKRHYCPQVEPRIETVLAVTLAGRAALPVLDGVSNLKNYIKTDQRLLRLARRVTWHLGPRTRP